MLKKNYFYDMVEQRRVKYVDAFQAKGIRGTKTTYALILYTRKQILQELKLCPYK